MHTVPSRLIIGQYRPLEGEGESNAVIYIRNGRPFQSALTLDGQGFMRAARPSSVADFKNKAEVDAVYPGAVQRAGCDARSLAPADLAEADAVFDIAEVPEWSFEGWVVRYNPSHRWSYFSGMNRDDVLVFKTSESDPNESHCVPHSAFDDPSCPAAVPPRASIEMRGTAYWCD